MKKKYDQIAFDKITRKGYPSIEKGYGRKLITALLIILFVVVFPFDEHSNGIAAVEVSGNHSAIFPGQRPSMPFDLSGYIQVPDASELNPSGGEMTI
jgi:hypothetical protein